MVAEEDTPPWVTPKFDVKKKPPPVPKLRPRPVEPEQKPTPQVPSSRPRWGQLEASQSEADARLDAAEVSSGETGTAKSSEVTPAKLSPEEGYRESWQRWQHLPNFLEERRQKLMEKPAERPAQPPSQEALDFLEALLSGTEPSTASAERPQEADTDSTDVKDADDTEAVTSAGAAQVLSAAHRLKAQAEEARRRRYEAPESRQPKAEQRNKADVQKSSESEKDPVAFEQREQQRRQEHERRLRELATEAERERQELLKQMEKDQADVSARRQEQEAWQEELAHKTRVQKQTAEREMRARHSANRFDDDAWRRKWWQDWQRTEAKRRQKEEEHAQWSQQWREQFRSQEEEGSSESDKEHGDRAGSPPRRSGLEPPTMDADTEKELLLQDLRPKRSQPLEERKRIWRALCLRWHPDKSQDKEKATRVFQHLSSLKDWFLAT